MRASTPATCLSHKYAVFKLSKRVFPREMKSNSPRFHINSRDAENPALALRTVVDAVSYVCNGSSSILHPIIMMKTLPSCPISPSNADLTPLAQNPTPSPPSVAFLPYRPPLLPRHSLHAVLAEISSSRPLSLNLVLRH